MADERSPVRVIGGRGSLRSRGLASLARPLFRQPLRHDTDIAAPLPRRAR